MGDKVRVSRVKGTYEVFTISKVLNTEPVTYQLTDYDDELINGSFYENELLKTNVPDHYEIEKILETRGTGNKKEYLVKFYGWGNKFNTWLTEDQIKQIPGEKEDIEEVLSNRKRNASKFWENMLKKRKNESE